MILADFLLPGSVSLKRIRIRLIKMKRIQTDPDPQHCFEVVKVFFVGDGAVDLSYGRTHLSRPSPHRHPLPGIQGAQLYMAVLFWYLWKSDLSSVRYTCTMDKQLFPRYQKNTALFNWSACSFLYPHLFFFHFNQVKKFILSLFLFVFLSFD